MSSYYNKFLKYKLKNQQGGLTPEEKLARKQELIDKYKDKKTLCISQHFKQHLEECWNDSVQYVFAFSDACKDLVQKKLLNLTPEEMLELAELNERKHLIPFELRDLDGNIYIKYRQNIIKYLQNFKDRLIQYIINENQRGFNINDYATIDISAPLQRINTKQVSIDACIQALDLLGIKSDKNNHRGHNNIDNLVCNLLSYIFLDNNDTFIKDNFSESTNFCLITFCKSSCHAVAFLKCNDKYIYYNDEQTNTEFNWFDYINSVKDDNKIEGIIKNGAIITDNWKKIFIIREEGVNYSDIILELECFTKKSLNKEEYNIKWNPLNNTELMFAYNKDEDIIKLLIERTDINIKNKDNETALFIAIKNKNIGMIKLLLEKGADVNVINKNGDTLLSTAIDNINNKDIIEIIGLLIDKGVNVNKTKVLINAIRRQCNIETLQLLIDKGADINAIDDVTEGISENLIIVRRNIGRYNNDTPLITATKMIEKINVSLIDDTINLLIRKDANINAENKLGETALFCAVKYNVNNDIIQVLIDKSVNVNVENNGETILMLAIMNEYNNNIIKLLIDKGANVNKTKLLINAIIKRYDIEIIQLLIDKGADINATYYKKEEISLFPILIRHDKHDDTYDINNGNTPLIIALKKKANNEIIKLLIEKGADVNIDESAVIHALESQYEDEIIKLLIEKGANVNAIDHSYNHNTILINAISFNKSIEIIELLINKGADVNAKNTSEKTPLIIAKENSNKEIIDLLIKNGAIDVPKPVISELAP